MNGVVICNRILIFRYAFHSVPVTAIALVDREQLFLLHDVQLNSEYC